MAFPAVESLVDEDMPAVDSLVDDFPDAANLVDDEVTPEVAAEAQRASTGALQAIDVMNAPTRLDWSEANEGIDAQRLAESRAALARAKLAEEQGSGTGPGSEAFGWRRESDFQLGRISPNTAAGREIAQGGEAQLQSIAEDAANDQQNAARTPSEMISGLLGPGLSQTAMPTIEAAGRHLGGATGGALGAALATAATVGTGGVAPLIFGLGSAMFGSMAGGQAQEGILKATETDEETEARHERDRQAAAQYPGANIAGGLLATRPFFGPSLAQFGRAAAGDRGSAANILMAGSIGAAGEMVGAAMRGEVAKGKDIATAFFSNAVMNEPTKFGRALGLHPSSEQRAIEDAQKKYGETPPPPPRTVEGPTDRDLATGTVTEDVNVAPPDVFAGVPPPQEVAPIEIVGKTEPKLIGTAIRLPDGTPLQGTEPNQSHAEIIGPAIDKADPDGTGGYIPATDDLGFAVQNPDGSVTFVDRTEGAKLAKEQGLIPEDAPDSLTSELLQEHAPKVEGVAPEPVVEPAPPEAPPGEAPAPAPLSGDSTSNKEVVVNAERAARAQDPVIKEATIENEAMIDYAERAIEANPNRPQEIIDRLRSAPPEERTISMTDGGILLIERTKLRTRRDAALARASRKEGSKMDRAIAEAEFAAAEDALNSMDQAAQDARSTWGRFGQLWQRSMREDFSLVNLERRARMSKDGPLTEKDLSNLKGISDKAAAAHEALQTRKAELETKATQDAIDGKIAEVTEKNAPVDPAVKSLADRIIARLDLASKNAEKSLKSKLSQLGAAPDPTIIIDVAKIAAAKTAKKTIEFAQWSADMIKEFGEKVRPFLQAGWDQREQHIDTAIDAGAGRKKKEVAARVKKVAAPLDAAAQQARIETAIGKRIKEGKPISSLAPYVNKLQESFISQGIGEREALIDAVHDTLKQHDPAITRDDAMEVMSKYGADYATQLNRDPVKMTRREVDGQIQQLLKLRDISAKVPLPKSGPERPTPGPVWRSLIKQVNAAKKKLGVVVTDPETQLKSSQDGIRTRMRNDIEDMTLELETGVKPPEKKATEYTEDMEILRGVRDRVRQTLRDIEGNPKLTDEQRIAMSKRSAEDSLAMWERRLAGEQAKVRKGVTNPEIEAIKARRDAVKAQVEEIDAADAVLQENKKAEALVRQIQNTENQLVNSSVRAKTQGADSEMIAAMREELRTVREALSAKNAADPQRQMEAVEKAERALEASIKKLDEQIQAGDISTKAKRTGPQSERLDYLRSQRDAMTKLRTQLRNEAKPRLSADQLAIKMKTTQMLHRAAELRQRIATGDFGPRTRKPPVDISGDTAALDAQADLMGVDADFQKLQEQWKLDQMNWVQKRWRNLGQTWDAGANLFLSFDLSTPLQTAFAMASHPVEGAKAIGKGAKAFYEQFFKWSDDYARREAARIANSTNSKNGIYKQMKLELPSAMGKKREENMSNVMEQLADLDARWAGLPDVVKGIFKMEGKTLVKGGKRLASVIPKIAGSGIKASNAAFETIANQMRARTADMMLARSYKSGGPAPTKQQLELIGELVNISTGKGGLKGGDSVRRILFAPNYYLSIMKQLSGYQLLKAGAYHMEGRVAKNIATEYVRAIATMGAIYGMNALFGNKVATDPRDKNYGRAMTDRGTSVDLTMGRGAWITAMAQIFKGQRMERGRAKPQSRKETFLNFMGGRLSRGVSTALTSAFGEDYRGKPTAAADIAKDFVIPLSWRDFDDVIKREGFTRGSFLQLLNTLGINYRVAK